ncbi:unnamed protein product [Amaranthus hypochondriacus]
MGGPSDEEFQHGHGHGFQLSYDQEFDDDGKPKRTGTMWTASAHIITAVIGSGVLSLAWATAQLGWLGGVTTLIIFSGIMLYTSNLLADCYRSPNPITGKRNYSYMDVVQANLGRLSCIACGVIQYANLSGFVVGYTITAPISMVAIHKSHCFHQKGHNAACKFDTYPYIIGYGICEIFLSQIPKFHQLTCLSAIAAIMSFAYASIGIGLAIARIVSGNGGRTTLTGVEIGMGVTTAQKTWKMLTALGDIAFAYGFTQVLVDIQDTLKSSPSENKVMKKANAISMLTTTVFYMLCGCVGYAAFGNDAPGNMLTGFGFYEPFWLIDLANIFIVIHLVGAYQVLAQPIFKKIESLAIERWPNSSFVKAEYPIRIGSKTVLCLNSLRLVGRTTFVMLITLIAMAMPFFNDIIALLGALGFWPLSVYFPIQMHINQHKIKQRSFKWFMLQLLNLSCLLVSLAAAVASVQGISEALRTSKLFQFKL